MSAYELKFDFITDAELRATLESDYSELQVCAKQGAWKAVHVLAGSLVEAVLVEYLLSAGQKSPDPLKMSLADLVGGCQKAGALSQTTGELCSALKSYRNLIHPGRSTRLGERVDADSGHVVQSLVSMIVREVSETQQQEYGFTAEQIVNKFESDPSAIGIAQHLLRDAPAEEVERLLMQVLPDRYFEEVESIVASPDVLDSHRTLFRAAFKAAPEAVKKKVMSRYVTVLREEPGPRVQVYEEEFFAASDLAFVATKYRDLVKTHLLARLREAPSFALVRATQGVGSHLSTDDVTRFVDAFVRIVVYEREDLDLVKAARQRFEGEASVTPVERDPEIRERLDAWIEMFQARPDIVRTKAVRDLRTAYEFAEPPEDD